MIGGSHVVMLVDVLLNVKHYTDMNLHDQGYQEENGNSESA